MKSFAGQLAAGTDKQSGERPLLNLAKVSSEAIKMGDLKDTSKKARYSNMVFQLEDDQLELDESDINELDQNMQVYLRFQKSLTTRFNFKKKSIRSSKTFHRMLDNSENQEQDSNKVSKVPTSTLFGRLQKGLLNKKPGKAKNPKKKKFNFSEAYESHSSTARLELPNTVNENQSQSHQSSHHYKRVSLINPPRSQYRYREDAVLEADKEEDSFEEDDEFDSDDGGVKKKEKNSSTFWRVKDTEKSKDIFTQSFEKRENIDQVEGEQIDPEVEKNYLQYMREMKFSDQALKLKTSKVIMKKLIQADNEMKLQRYDSQLNDQFIKQLEKAQDNVQRYHIFFHYALIGLIVLNNLFSIFVFLMDDYISNRTTAVIIDSVVLFFFIVEFFYNLYNHPHPKSAFFYLYYTWIDIATMITPIITMLIDEDKLQHIQILRILRVSKVIRILRLVKMIKNYTILNQQHGEDDRYYMQLTISPILQQVVLLASQLLIIEFLGAALVNVISETLDDSFTVSLAYLDALYYMIITSATVGYGDIYPKTLVARITVVTILLCVFIVFGDNISKIGQLMRQANFNDRQYYMKDHFVIFGNHKAKELGMFIWQLIELKTFDQLPEILIVGTKLLKHTDLEPLIKHELIESKVKYLCTEGIDQATLRKSNIQNAQAVFFIGHLNVIKSSNAYTQNLLHKIKQIEQFVEAQNKKTKIQFLDLFKRKNQQQEPLKFYVQLSSAFQIQNFLSQDYIIDFQDRMYSVNIYKFKCELLAQALFSPGIVPLVANFFINQPEKIPKERIQACQSVQYKNLSYKMRVAKFPQELIGQTFYEAVKITCKSQQSAFQESKYNSEPPELSLLQVDSVYHALEQLNGGQMNQQGQQPKKKKIYLKMLLFGVVPQPKEGGKKLALQSLINPGSDYVISVTDRAYLMVREIGEFDNLPQERLDQIYQQQITEAYNQNLTTKNPMGSGQMNQQQHSDKRKNSSAQLPSTSANTQLNTERNSNHLKTTPFETDNAAANLDTDKPLITEDGPLETQPNLEPAPKFLGVSDSARPLILSDIKIKKKKNLEDAKSPNSNRKLLGNFGADLTMNQNSEVKNKEERSSSLQNNKIQEKSSSKNLPKITLNPSVQQPQESEEAKKARVIKFLQRRFLSAITEKEVETQLMQSFENYLRSLYTYKICLKKYQYLLWDEDKIHGKISNHILIFGFNSGVIHFVKAIREKCDLPIVFFFDEDISLDIFKMNNVYGNIFHFWGDPFDKSHLDKSSITHAYGVIILQDHRKEKQVLEDGTAINIYRNIEQFYEIERLICEVSDPERFNMIGYEPKDDQSLQPVRYYYWPFFMNGRILAGNVFLSMIAWTQEKENHLETFKKFVSNDLLQKNKKQKQLQRLQEQEEMEKELGNQPLFDLLENPPNEFSNILTLQVPPLYPLRNKTFLDMMTDFMTMNCLCIGIYRQIKQTKHENLLEDEFSFMKDDQMAKTFTIRNRELLKESADHADDFDYPAYLDQKIDSQGNQYDVLTTLSDFKCNFSNLHTEQLILNPSPNFKLQLDDKVLVLGEIPVKSCENFLLMHRMKQRNTNGLSVRQERRQLALEALESKLKRRDKNLSELQRELFQRTQKYTQFQSQNKIRRSNLQIELKEGKGFEGSKSHVFERAQDQTSKSGLMGSVIQSEQISSFTQSQVQEEQNQLLVNNPIQNQFKSSLISE